MFQNKWIWTERKIRIDVRRLRHKLLYTLNCKPCRPCLPIFAWFWHIAISCSVVRMTVNARIEWIWVDEVRIIKVYFTFTVVMTTLMYLALNHPQEFSRLRLQAAFQGNVGFDLFYQSVYILVRAIACYWDLA